MRDNMNLVKSNGTIEPEAMFVEAYRYEEKRDFKNAFKCLSTAARLGHTGSQINLGNFYSWGKGVRKNAKDAAYWYRQAYKNGDSTGAFNLAIDKRNEGNTRAAVIWFKKALEMKYGEAAVELAKIYMVRRGGKETAIDLLKSTRSMKPDEISDDGKEEAASLLSKLVADQKKS
jgi:TPR repeat protein